MVIGLTGTNGAGKTSGADYLRELGFQYLSLSDEIRLDWADYSSAQGEGGATLGEHFKFQK